jgi:hypothetical protein
MWRELWQPPMLLDRIMLPQKMRGIRSDRSSPSRKMALTVPADRTRLMGSFAH